MRAPHTETFQLDITGSEDKSSMNVSCLSQDTNTLSLLKLIRAGSSGNSGPSNRVYPQLDMHMCMSACLELLMSIRYAYFIHSVAIF